MTVRMDAAQLRRFFRVAKKLDEPSAAALLRKLVIAIISGDRERREVLSDILGKLDAMEGEQLVLSLERDRAKAARGSSDQVEGAMPG